MHQLDYIGVFLQAKVKNRVFVKLDSRYAEYFSEYSSYFGIALILLKYMYEMTNSGKLISYELTEWMIYAGLIQYQFQMSIYYKSAPDGTKNIVLYYVDGCAYRYTSEALGKWFVDTLGKILHVKFLWFVN